MGANTVDNATGATTITDTLDKMIAGGYNVTL